MEPGLVAEPEGSPREDGSWLAMQDSLGLLKDSRDPAR